MDIRNALTIAAGIVGGLAATRASADTNIYCISAAMELSEALSTISATRVDTNADEIRIRIGTYHAPPAGFAGAATTGHNLSILGGYVDAACQERTFDASMTILDGNGMSTVVTIDTASSDANVEVSGLTFRNGKGVASDINGVGAGGLKVGDPGPIGTGGVLIDRNIFLANEGVPLYFPNTSFATGGLLAATDGVYLIVRNNLFSGNISSNASAAFVFSNNPIDFSNNTVVGNIANDQSQMPRSSVFHFTITALRLTSNIFWANGGGENAVDFDFDGYAPDTVASAANDFELVAGLPHSTISDRNVDPLFVGPTSMRLSSSSPLINVGTLAPGPGGLSLVDLDGAPRVDSAAVDIGAYETSYIFVDGFGD